MQTNNPSSHTKKEILQQDDNAFHNNNNLSISQRYNETKIALLPRDPRWIFTYWDISDEKRKDISLKFGKSIFENSQFILRVFGVKNDLDSDVHHFFDVTANMDEGNWYINVQNSMDKKICVEMGIKTPDGLFISIARSNIVELPFDTISNDEDETWFSIKGYSLEEILRLSSLGFNPLSYKEVYKALLYRLQLQSMLNTSSFGINRKETSEYPLTQKREIEIPS